MSMIKGGIGKIWEHLCKDRGDLVTWDMEKTELTNALLWILLHSQMLQSHSPEGKGRGWEKEQSLTVG